MAADSLYITLTDFRGQRYVVESDERDAGNALVALRDKIVNGEPIACDIVHDNNHGKTLTIFHGPVTLSHHYEREWEQPAC